MKTSPSIATIAPALIRAQANIGAAPKDAKNPFFDSSYADLGSVMAVCKEPLLAQGISVLQPLTTRENGDIVLETILLHESGEFIESSMKITPAKRMITPKSDKERFEPYLAPDPQAEGSAITYARRYALQALVFIPSVDDDAEWAARALANRPLPAETVTKLEAKVDATLAAADVTTDEAERQRLHQEAMKLEKGIQQRSAESLAIAAYEDANPEHRNKVANATQDAAGNWTFTIVGGEKTTPAKRTRKAATTAAAEPSLDTPWREVVCLIGQRPGTMADKTLEQIFIIGRVAPKNQDQLEALVGWFVTQAIHTSPKESDKALWKAVQEAKAELSAAFATGASPSPAIAPATPEASKPAQQPPASATPTDWRAFVVPGKHAFFSGKTLGSFSAEEIKRLNTEYLAVIDWPKATLSQRSLKAQVGLALAEVTLAMAELDRGADDQALQPEPPENLHPDDEPHTEQLRFMIEKSGLNRNDLFKIAHSNDWIAKDHTTIESVTEDEVTALGTEWIEVEKAVRAAQP